MIRSAFQSAGAMFFFILASFVFVGCDPAKDGQSTAAGADARVQALIYLSKGELNEAETAFRKAVKESSNEALNYVDLSLLLLLKGDTTGVEDFVKKGLAVDPANVKLQLGGLSPELVARYQ